LKLLFTLPFLAFSLLAPGQTPKPGPLRRAEGRLLVVLDPGHGGDDIGARGAKGLLEKDAALELAGTLAAQLQEAGMDARITRAGDTFVPLWDRARIANEAGADLFISLHLNAARTRSAKGSEVFFLTLGSGDSDAEAIAALENAGGAQGPAPDPDNVVAGILDDLSQKAFLQDSERLAVAIQGQLNHLGGIRQRGVKQAPFVVLRGAAMPAVLVETAFISNPREEAKLKDPAFRRKVAQAITRGIRLFFTAGIPTTRRRAAAAPVS
jgi:N-acetylmuramoyl-L-alanine amidase